MFSERDHLFDRLVFVWVHHCTSHIFIKITCCLQLSVYVGYISMANTPVFICTSKSAANTCWTMILFYLWGVTHLLNHYSCVLVSNNSNLSPLGQCRSKEMKYKQKCLLSCSASIWSSCFDHQMTRISFSKHVWPTSDPCMGSMKETFVTELNQQADDELLLTVTNPLLLSDNRGFLVLCFFNFSMNLFQF